MWNYLCAVSVSRGGYLPLANQWLPVVCFDIIYMYIIKEFPSSSCATEENLTTLATDCIASNRPAQYFGGISNADTGYDRIVGMARVQCVSYFYLHGYTFQQLSRIYGMLIIHQIFRCLKVLHQILKALHQKVFTLITLECPFLGSGDKPLRIEDHVSDIVSKHIISS